MTGAVRLVGLPLPVSKNALHQPIRCGRFFKIVRTKKARLKAEEIITEIWHQLGGKLDAPIITRPCSVTWTITFPDKRKRDGANYEEQMNDCLQAAGVVADDCLIVHSVREVLPIFGRPGRVDLTVEELP